MCFEVHQALKKTHAAFDQERGFERGKERVFAISSDGILNIHMIDIFTTY